MRPSSTEKPARRGLAIAAGVLKVLVFVTAAAALNVLLTLALEPAGSLTEATWYEYRTSTAQGERFDTIIVGSSYASMNIDPYALDDALGSNSYEIAMPAQSLPNSRAALKTAVADHHPKRAIIPIAANTLQDTAWFNPQVTFLQAKSHGESLPQILENVATLALDETTIYRHRSITWMFPWLYNTVDLTREAIQENIELRRSAKNPVDAYRLSGAGAGYQGKGHEGTPSVMDLEAPATLGYNFTPDDPFLDKNLRDFTALLDYARDNGVQLYVIVSPLPAFANVHHAEDDYDQLMAGLADLVREHGGVYYDMNLLRPALGRMEDEEFSDSQHLTIDGAERMGAILGRLIAEEEAGQDTSDYFYGYDEYDEYLATFDPIVLCYYKSEVEADAIAFAGHATAQADVTVEYQYEAEDPDTGEWAVVRPYDTDPDYRYPLAEGHGNVHMRLNVRPAGSDGEPMCTFATDVSF